MENAMKKLNKNLISLEVSNIFRVCLSEIAQPGNSLEKCNSTLGVLPSYLLYAICHDPVLYLFNKKNIFLLINSFFKKNTIKKIGCEASAQLIMLPLHTIQAIACKMGLKEKILTNHLLENIVFNSINVDCSLSILPNTNEFLQSCYPEVDFTNSSEVINKNTFSTKILCLEGLKQVAIGERVKLCDNFQEAMACTYCDIDESTRMFFKLLSPNKNFTDEEMKSRMMPRYQKLRGKNITNASKEEIQFEIKNILLGEEIIEASACASIEAIRVPFFALTKACSSIPSHPFNETGTAINDSLYECEKSIESLTKEEKTVFCENPSFFFRNMNQDQYFNNSLQVVKTACDKYLRSEENDLQQTLDLIKASNAANNLTNTSLEEISSASISAIQADLLQIDEHYALSQAAGSSGLINTNTAFEKSTIEYGKVTAITGASLFGTIGVGYWLFKRFRNSSQNVKVCNDKQQGSELSEPFQLVSYSKI